MSADAEKDGWPEDLRKFATCWNEGRFFDAHETLEPRWIGSRDRGLRGLIQLAAAFLHLQRGNIVGARTTLERAIMRLSDKNNEPCQIDQAALALYAQGVLASLETAPLADIVANRPRL
jgi:predicted metal-dependent hydrolase